MKKIIFAIMLCVSLSAHAQWYTGMSQKTGLALCIHLISSSPSIGVVEEYSAVELYSPMQTQEPMPVSSWSLQGDKLTIECKKLGFKALLTRHPHSHSSPKIGEGDRPAGVVEEYDNPFWWRSMTTTLLCSGGGV